jgi:hypothetical protein
MTRTQPLSMWERVWRPFAAHVREPRLSLLSFDDEDSGQELPALEERRKKVEELRQVNRNINEKISDITHLLAGDENE